MIRITKADGFAEQAVFEQLKNSVNGKTQKSFDEQTASSFTTQSLQESSSLAANNFEANQALQNSDILNQLKSIAAVQLYSNIKTTKKVGQNLDNWAA